jgi:hypothetical protein
MHCRNIGRLHWMHEFCRFGRQGLLTYNYQFNGKHAIQLVRLVREPLRTTACPATANRWDISSLTSANASQVTTTMMEPWHARVHNAIELQSVVRIVSLARLQLSAYRVSRSVRSTPIRSRAIAALDSTRASSQGKPHAWGVASTSPTATPATSRRAYRASPATIAFYWALSSASAWMATAISANQTANDAITHAARVNQLQPAWLA